MSAPPKLSEGAERLHGRIHRLYGLSAEAVAHKICTELGITPEMVEDVRPLVQPSTRAPHAMNQNDAAIALATLLDVAGQ